MNIRITGENCKSLDHLSLLVDKEYEVKLYRGMSVVLLKNNELISQASFSGYLSLSNRGNKDYTLGVVEYTLKSALIALLVRYTGNNDHFSNDNNVYIDRFVKSICRIVKDNCISSSRLEKFVSEKIDLNKYVVFTSKATAKHKISIRYNNANLSVNIGDDSLKLPDDMKNFILLKTALQYNVDFCMIENMLLYSAYIMYNGNISDTLKEQIDHMGGRRLSH